MLKITFKLCIIAVLLIFVEGAKILMVYNAMSRSHYILAESLGLALAKKGHQVIQ